MEEKVNVRIVAMGSIIEELDVQRIKGWKSSLFHVEESIGRHYLPQKSDLEYDDLWAYSDDLLSQTLPKTEWHDGLDLTLYILDAPLEDNYFTRIINGNRILITYYEIKDYLLKENIPLENYLISNIYTYALLLLANYRSENRHTLSAEDEDAIVHDYHDECIYDMCGNKEDVVYSCVTPQVCSKCKEFLSKRGIKDEEIVNTNQELKRLNRSSYYQIVHKFKSYPIITFFSSCALAVLLNIIASVICGCSNLACNILAYSIIVFVFIVAVGAYKLCGRNGNKHTLILVFLTFGLFCISGINGLAQTKKRVPSRKSNTAITHTVTKTREVGEDGFIWYKLKKGNLYGVQDIEGKEIVPVKFDHIDYCASSYLYPMRFFRVKKGDFLGIYTRKGTCVITTNKHYIRLGGGTTPQGVADVVYWVAKKNDGGLIILDAKGKEIIPAERNYTEIKMMPDLDSHGTPYYFSVSQNRRGICDLNGKELCPSIYESCYIAGGTIIKNEINGTSASENIHYQGNTIFDYLSYDDLYNYETSSMHSSPSSSSSSSSNTISSSNNNSDSGTTTIVVEQHGPVQVWVACGGCQLSPGRCSYCNGSGWGYNNRLCSRCNGTGKCTICNGTGGHNEVQYR